VTITVQPSTAPTTNATTRSTAPTSSAPAPIEIPDVKGLAYEAAAAKISAAGFVPARRDEVSDQQPPGRVVGCDPSIGTKQPPGSTVTIIVAKLAPTTPAATTPPPTPKPTSPTPSNS
jgi:serine/threonine-protein kinase